MDQPSLHSKKLLTVVLKKTVNLTKKLGQTLGPTLGQTTQTQTPITNTDTDTEGDWYIGTDDGKFGPMTAEKVLNMLDTGELDKTNGNAFIAGKRQADIRGCNEPTKLPSRKETLATHRTRICHSRLELLPPTKTPSFRLRDS